MKEKAFIEWKCNFIILIYVIENSFSLWLAKIISSES